MARSQVLNFADNFKAVITTAAAWKSKPSWTLVAGADRTISPDLERWYATRANSHKVEVSGASHAVYVSRPKEVAALSHSMKTTGMVRGMSRSCIALLLFTCCALATQSLSAQKQVRKIRNIVLVHGFEVKSTADGWATVVLAAGSQHANPMGTLHGGVLCDIADAAMGIAFATTLAPDESFTTVELKINFFARSGRHNSKRKEWWCSGAARSATWSAPSPTRRTD